MNRDLKQLEEAIHTLRVDFPQILQDTCRAELVVQDLIVSERRKEEFDRVSQMLAAGMQPLIQQNIEPLKDSAVRYHSVHRKLEEAADTLRAACAKLKVLRQQLAGGTLQKSIEALKVQQKKEAAENQTSPIRQALALDLLTARDVCAGRIDVVSEHLKYVAAEDARAEIKKRAENRAWQLRKEIEKKVSRYVRNKEELALADLSALPRLNGSLPSVLRAVVHDALIDATCSATSSLRAHMQHKGASRTDAERDVLSRALGAYTAEVCSLVARTAVLLMKNRSLPEFSPPAAYRYAPALYRDISLGDKPRRSFASLQLPPPDTPSSEQDVLAVFERQIGKFFRALIGDAATPNAEEESAEDEKYALGAIARTPAASKMYSDFFTSRYGIESQSVHIEAPEQRHLDIDPLSVPQIATEENLLIVHGASLEICRALARAQKEVQPGSRPPTYALEKMGVAQCFNRKRDRLLSLVRAAARLPVATAGMLPKYTAKISGLLAESKSFVEMIAPGLEQRFQECMFEVFGALYGSLERAVKVSARAENRELLGIRYCLEDTEDGVISEISRWNDPQGKDVLGASVFSICTSHDLQSISDFLGLLQRAEATAKEIFDATKTLEVEAHVEELTGKLQNLASTARGYFTSHFLALVRLALEDLVSTGDIRRKRVLHFLSSDTSLLRIAAPIVQVYITVYLFMHIESCAAVFGDARFKLCLSAMQGKLDRVLERAGAPDALYVPEYVMYTIAAAKKRDRVYTDAVQRMYKGQPRVSESIGKYAAKIAARTR